MCLYAPGDEHVSGQHGRVLLPGVGTQRHRLAALQVPYLTPSSQPSVFLCDVLLRFMKSIRPSAKRAHQVNSVNVIRVQSFLLLSSRVY